MKRVIGALLTIFILWGCTQRPYEVMTTHAVEEWKVTDGEWATAATLYSASIYKDNIVMILKDNNEYAVNFFTLEGELQKRIPFSMGKGPGEVIYPYAFCIQDNIIYIYDNRLQKILKMDMDGKYSDDYLLNRFMGYFPCITVHNNDLYLSSVYGENLITWFDDHMNIKGAIAGDKTGRELEIGDRAYNGTLAVDHERNELYYSNCVLPYKIVKFNMKLEKKGELTSNLVYGYDGYYFTGRLFEGDLVISNMIIKDHNLYTSVCMRKKSKDKPFFINIFDLEKSKLKYHIICPNLTEVADDAGMTVRVLGVENDKIYLFVVQYNPEKKKVEMSIMSVKNPIKGDCDQ